LLADDACIVSLYEKHNGEAFIPDLFLFLDKTGCGEPLFPPVGRVTLLPFLPKAKVSGNCAAARRLWVMCGTKVA
jgi:hypothetical protein